MEDANSCHLKEIFKLIDATEAKEQNTFYVEIIAVSGFRTKK